VATFVSGCGVCTDSVARCTALSTHTTTWNTCCHNTATLLTMYFYWLILQKCNFSQPQRKLSEDGPYGPKHLGANIRYFNAKFKHFICLIKGAFVGENNFERYQNARYNNKKNSNTVVFMTTWYHFYTLWLKYTTGMPQLKIKSSL
jgi:hypothetical protein